MREEASELRWTRLVPDAPPRHFARITSQSVAKGVRVMPDLPFQVLAIGGQLIVSTCHRSGNRTRAFAVATKGISRFKPVLSYDPFLGAETEALR